MTPHEQFRKLEQDIRTKLKELHELDYVIDIQLSAKGVEYKGSYNGCDWQTISAKWSQFDKPDLYALALEKMRLMYKTEEKPLAYLERSDRVELTYPNYRVLFTMEFLLDRSVKSR